MASTQVQTVYTSADKAKLAAAVLLVLLSVLGFYWLPQQDAWAKWTVLLVGLALAGISFFLTPQGTALIGFGREAWKELQKVVWPERKEALMMTAYVFGFVLLMAIFLWASDKTLEWLIYDLILGWKK